MAETRTRGAFRIRFRKWRFGKAKSFIGTRWCGEPTMVKAIVADGRGQTLTALTLNLENYPIENIPRSMQGHN
jgi:hypothetical protein